jgi:hypothetical protein
MMKEMKRKIPKQNNETIFTRNLSKINVLIDPCWDNPLHPPFEFLTPRHRHLSTTPLPCPPWVTCTETTSAISTITSRPVELLG